jgi:D-amino-acid dehydrogenase
MSENTTPDDVVVIGGGIVGASCAYALARRGARVTLVDRGDLGQATAAGAGILSPGTSLRPLPAFFALARPAVAYYPHLLAQLAEDGETETGYAVAGLLHVATSADELEGLSALAQLFEERRDAGFSHIGDVRLLSGDEARALFPALGPIPGAVATTGAARVDGRLLRDALRRAAARRGARILAGEARLEREENGRVAMTMNGARHPAATIVLAGGAWTAEQSEALGIALPVFPQRGQILHLDLPGAETSRWPIIVGYHSHYLLTFPEHRVVAGATRESGSGFDVRMTAGGVAEALGDALRVAPGLAPATLREVRIGLRPASPDGLPLIGRVPGAENLVVATGHGPSGLQLGPYSGLLAAEMALGEPPAAEVDLTAFAPGRFLAG